LEPSELIAYQGEPDAAIGTGYQQDGLVLPADRRDEAGRTIAVDAENAIVIVEPESAVWASDHATRADVRASCRPDIAESGIAPVGRHANQSPNGHVDHPNRAVGPQAASPRRLLRGRWYLTIRPSEVTWTTRPNSSMNHGVPSEPRTSSGSMRSVETTCKPRDDCAPEAVRGNPSAVTAATARTADISTSLNPSLEALMRRLLCLRLTWGNCSSRKAALWAASGGSACGVVRG
jgi:hypothetical protein